MSKPFVAKVEITKPCSAPLMKQRVYRLFLESYSTWDYKHHSEIVIEEQLGLFGEVTLYASALVEKL